MKPVSILIIDDDEMDRYLLKRLIKKSNIPGSIFEKTDGQKALDFLSDYDDNLSKFGDDFPPILIFLDINMPIMGGFEFLEAFAKLKRTSNHYNSSVFTMFTSSDREEDKAKAAAYDFVKGYVTKDKISVEKLIEVVKLCENY